MTSDQILTRPKAAYKVRQNNVSVLGDNLIDPVVASPPAMEMYKQSFSMQAGSREHKTHCF